MGSIPPNGAPVEERVGQRPFRCHLQDAADGRQAAIDVREGRGERLHGVGLAVDRRGREVARDPQRRAPYRSIHVGDRRTARRHASHHDVRGRSPAREQGARSVHVHQRVRQLLLGRVPRGEPVAHGQHAHAAPRGWCGRGPRAPSGPALRGTCRSGSSALTSGSTASRTLAMRTGSPGRTTSICTDASAGSTTAPANESEIEMQPPVLPGIRVRQHDFVGDERRELQRRRHHAIRHLTSPPITRPATPAPPPGRTNRRRRARRRPRSGSVR